jgi:hypothetical protein
MIAGCSMGCSANYKFGDLSKSYCASTNPDFREVIKNNLADMGVELGVDYCTVRGLVDAMVTINDQAALPVDYGGVMDASFMPYVKLNNTLFYDYGGIDERQVNSNKLVYRESNILIDNFAKVQNQNFERWRLV